MLKTLGAVVGGVFVGAVVAEVIHKKYPNVMNKLYTKTREIASEAKEAFKNGYTGAARSQASAQASA